MILPIPAFFYCPASIPAKVDVNAQHQSCYSTGAREAQGRAGQGEREGNVTQQIQHGIGNGAAAPIPVQGNLPFCALISQPPKPGFSVKIFQIHA